MNLHSIVSGAIGQVNAHETITLYRCEGLSNVAGRVSVTYAKESIIAQVQAPSAADIKLSERFADAKHVKKFYINAPASTINRFEETAGDIIQRADGSYWLIDTIRDDFSPAGWLCVICTLQHEPPEGVTEEGGNSDGS